MLKEFFGSIFGFDDEIDRLQIIVEKLIIEIDSWKDKLKQKRLDYQELEKELEDKKPVEIPSADITHSRQVLVSPKKHKFAQIDIRNFIMPDFAMKRKLERNGLIFDGTQDLDELMPKVYHLAKSGYKYGADKEYGFDEYWMFPFELQTNLSQGNAGDCDDWANLIGSYFAAANIPRDRWLISCGMARAGFGHSTVYAKDNTGIWRHLNSTKPEYKSSHLSGFPSNKDKNDLPGIKDKEFWYSYNDVFSLHKFESKGAKGDFVKSGKKMEIRVEK